MIEFVVQHWSMIGGRYLNWAQTAYAWVPAHVESRRKLHPLPVRIPRRPAA